MEEVKESKVVVEENKMETLMNDITKIEE